MSIFKTKMSYCDDKFAEKGMGNKLLDIIQNVCYFNTGLSI